MKEMIEISTENVKRITVWLKPELLSRMDGWLETANCKNRSEFISKALRFYMGYLATDDVSSYVCESVSQNIRGMLSENTNRISKLMFKWSVELNMMMHIVAAHFKDFAVVDNPLRTKTYPDMPMVFAGCYLGDGIIDFERILAALIEKAPEPHGMCLLAEPAFKLPTNDAERDDRVEYNRKISRQYVAKMLEIVEKF